MSGPVDQVGSAGAGFGVSTVEVRQGRSTRIGRTAIMRILPTKRRRTIGPWCFVDLMSPDDLEDPPALEIGPHPHIGLATVTWLFAGEVVHSDSLGTTQPIRPGELNLMTSGAGIAHAEQGVSYRVDETTGSTMGAQMWLAQTDDTRTGESSFQHIDSLPHVEFGSIRGSLLIGSAAGETSPAVVDHPTIGLDLVVDGKGVVPKDPGFEYGVVPIDRSLKVAEAIVEPGSLAILPPGGDMLDLETHGPGRVMIVGGEPLGTEITMWWNFVARSKDEIAEAWRDWSDVNTERFGPVPSPLARIDAPTPPWIRGE